MSGYNLDELLPERGLNVARINFGLRTVGGIARYRRFIEEAADLVLSHGGSLSGEHGDGQSCGELLPKMFGPRLVAAFAGTTAARPTTSSCTATRGT